MKIDYITYSRNAIKAEPRSCWIGGWRIDYLPFAHPGTMDRPPLLVRVGQGEVQKQTWRNRSPVGQ